MGELDKELEKYPQAPKFSFDSKACRDHKYTSVTTSMLVQDAALTIAPTTQPYDILQLRIEGKRCVKITTPVIQYLTHTVTKNTSSSLIVFTNQPNNKFFTKLKSKLIAFNKW